MKVSDFEYDGFYLSDFGFIICSFDSKGMQTLSGSKITFNTLSIHNGEKQELVNSEYSDCLGATFQICKKPCNNDDNEITMEEFRDLMSWLNRKQYYKFKFIDNKEYEEIYFEASFNISKIESGGKLVGLELEMFTNRPYALHEPISILINNTSANGTKTIINQSDEEGYIYPSMKITINQTGDLTINNAFEKKTMLISNCTKGEIITINYPIIQSSLSAHKIQNDFNWNFFRLCSTFNSKKNNLTISIPCTIEMSYSPVVKISI